MIQTYAGSHFGDGASATQASVNYPFDMAVDKAGNLYIVDTYDNCVREVIAATGIITTVAGTGAPGYEGDGGPATQALLNGPQGLAMDGAGNLYFTDYGNNRVREVAGIGAPGSGPEPTASPSPNVPNTTPTDTLAPPTATNTPLPATATPTAGSGSGAYVVPPAAPTLNGTSGVPGESSDENWIASDSGNTTQPSASITVNINRFYGALAQDPSITNTASVQFGSLYQPKFVTNTLGQQGMASVQLEAYGLGDLGTPVIAPCPAGGSTGCTLNGAWEADPHAPGWSIFTANSVPAADLNFPNLNLTSSTQIDPPYSAPNTFVVDGPAGGSGTAITWARIQALAPRPVALIHGIAVVGFSPSLDLGSLLAKTDPQFLSGWTTWKCWTSECTNQVGQTNFLYSIGVPNIRPDEESDQAATRTPTSSDPNNPGHYVSDARVYVSTSHHYWENAKDVNDHIAMVLRRYGVDSINLVTHSMGGLDASWAILGDGSAVSHLVMLAPPYIGSDLADYFRQRPLGIGDVLDVGFSALDDLTRAYWIEHMPKGIEPNPLTADYAIIGTNSHGLGPTLDAVPDLAFGYDCLFGTAVLCAHIYTNDTAVPEYNARAAPGQFLGTVPADSHFTITQDPTVFSDVQALLGSFAPGVQAQARQAQTQVRTATQAARRTRATTAARVQTAGSMTAMAAPDTGQSDTIGGSGVQYGPLLSGSVQPSTTVTATFALPANPTTAETLVWDTGTLTMTLVDPSGRAVTPVSAGVAYTQTAEADGSGALAYTLSSPTPGTWTAIITDTATSGQATNYQLGASYASPVTLSAPGGAAIYQPGAGVPVSVTLADATGPVAGATVTATAELSGTVPVTVTLQDMGNGVYGGSFGALSTPGQYEVHLVATGTDNGQPFVSTGLSFVTVASGGATLTGAYAEGTETDAFGLYSALTITPTIQVTTSGTYRLQGTLVDAAGDVVGTAGTSAALSAGTTQALALRFDGQAIGATGKDGPYQLRDVTLMDASSGVELFDDRVPLAYTTDAYAASQFARPLVSILPGTSDVATGSNGAGQYSALSVAFTATAALSDSYQIVATLAASDGQGITSVTQTAALSATPSQVTLPFSGADIAAHGIDGPYTVVGVTIVPASQPATYVSYPGFYVTQPYSASTFGGSASATSTPGAPTATATSTAAPPTSTSTPLPPTVTSTDTPVPPTATATTMPTSTSTGTATPTNTTPPTPTSTATRTATPSPTMTATSTATPTLIATATRTPAPTMTATPPTLPTATMTATRIPTATATATATPFTVDDSVQGTGANQFAYTGAGWRHCSAASSPSCSAFGLSGLYGGTISADDTASDSMSITFVGTGIKLYSSTAKVGGIGAVFIDNVRQVRGANFYSASIQSGQLVWSVAGLPRGSHTFKLQVSGTKDAASSAYAIGVDDVVITP